MASPIAPHRRIGRFASALACAALMVGCGGGDAGGTESVAPVDTDAAATADTGSGESVGTSALTTVAEPDDQAVSGGRLSIADAMLPDSAFPPPWEPHRRDPAVIGYGAGPNQSSCPEYEIAEQFAGRSGGHVFWWVDGGNANHYVSREEYVGEGADIVAMVAAAAERCGTVTWGEGGAVELQALALGDGAAGFSMQTVGSDERGLVAATTHGDLISMLWVPMWPGPRSGEYPEFTIDDFAATAQEARSLLLNAGPAGDAELAPTPTLARPSNEPLSITPDSSAVPTSTTPPTSTMPSTAATVPLDRETAVLMLEPGDLDGRWRHESTEPQDATVGEANIPDLEGCGYEDALRQIEPGVEVYAEWSLVDGPPGTAPRAAMSQTLATVESASVADEIVRRFAESDDCDFDRLLGDAPDAESEAGVTAMGGMLEGIAPDGMVAELSFVIEWYHLDDLRREEATLVMVAVGPNVSLLSVSSLTGEPMRDVALEVAAAAIEKLAGGES